MPSSGRECKWVLFAAISNRLRSSIASPTWVGIERQQRAFQLLPSLSVSRDRDCRRPPWIAHTRDRAGFRAKLDGLHASAAFRRRHDEAAARAKRELRVPFIGPGGEEADDRVAPGTPGALCSSASCSASAARPRRCASSACGPSRNVRRFASGRPPRYAVCRSAVSARI